jgi:hypothetical protein
MTKTFTVAGLATDTQGKTKVKYANDLDKRLKVLKRDGFTNLNFIHSKESLGPIELCYTMLGMIQYQNDKHIILKEIDRQDKRNKKILRKQTLFTGTAEQLLEAIQ